MRYPILLLPLWALGSCMVLMAALVRIPIGALAGLSIAVIALHNCLDGIDAARFGSAAWVWSLVHLAGPFSLGKVVVVAPYPLVPWFAVMAAGFCFGKVLLMEPAARQRIARNIGLGAIAAFVAIRAVNVYGDPGRWAVQRSGTFTVLSFLNTVKYPPSLDFLLMTLGPALLALAFLDRLQWKAGNPFVVVGRVPLFFFLIHFYAIHLLAAAMAWIQYGNAAFRFIFNPLPSMGGPQKLFPPGFGYDLWVVYVVWAGIVLSIYPLCRWYANVKATRRDSWWLSYL
jgi:uncharacterized membrane protein